MKDSIHKYFKVGLVQWMTHPPDNYDILHSIKTLACDEFFDAIEIGLFHDSEVREKAKMMLDASHLEVCYGAQPRILGPDLNPNHTDEKQRIKAEKTLLEAIDEAKFLGSKSITFLAGKFEEETKELAYQQLLKTTRNLCDYAAVNGILVELEVFDYDVDKCTLIGPAQYAARFATDVRTTHKNFGLLVDQSHIPITHESFEFVIKTLAPYITHFHIGNAVTKKGCEAYGDKHPRFGFPNSANDVQQLLEFFTVLKKEGFFRVQDPYVLTIEVKPWEQEDGDIVLANTKRTINRAWALLEE